MRRVHAVARRASIRCNSSLAVATKSTPAPSIGQQNESRQKQQRRLEKSKQERESNRVSESREVGATPTQKILAKKSRLTSLQEYQRDPKEVKSMQGHVLAAAVAASGNAKLVNPCLWAAYAKRTKEISRMLTARSCVLIARGFALAGQRNLEVFEAISNRLVDKDSTDIFEDHVNGRLKALDSSQLVLLVTALSRLDVYDGPLLVGIAKELRGAHLHSLDPRGFGAFVQGYASLGAAECVPKPNSFWKVKFAFSQKLSNFRIQEALRIAFLRLAYASAGKQRRQSYQKRGQSQALIRSKPYYMAKPNRNQDSVLRNAIRDRVTKTRKIMDRLKAITNSQPRQQNELHPLPRAFCRSFRGLRRWPPTCECRDSQTPSPRKKRKPRDDIVRSDSWRLQSIKFLLPDRSVASGVSGVQTCPSGPTFFLPASAVSPRRSELWRTAAADSTTLRSAVGKGHGTVAEGSVVRKGRHFMSAQILVLVFSWGTYAPARVFMSSPIICARAVAILAAYLDFSWQFKPLLKYVHFLGERLMAGKLADAEKRRHQKSKRSKHRIKCLALGSYAIPQGTGCNRFQHFHQRPLRHDASFPPRGRIQHFTCQWEAFGRLIQFQDVERAAIPKLSNFEVGAVALLAHGFSMLGQRHEQFLDAAAEYIPQFDASSLSFMINAMARVQWQTQKAVQAIQERIEEQDGEGVPHKPTDIAQMMSGLGRLSVHLSDSAYVMLATAAMRQASELSGAHLAMLFVGLVRLAPDGPDRANRWLVRLCPGVISASARMNWADLAAIASSLSRAGVDNTQVWAAIHQEGISRLQEAATLPPPTSKQVDATPPRLRVCLRSLATFLVAEGPTSLTASQLVVSSVPVMTRLLKETAAGDYNTSRKAALTDSTDDSNLQALTMLLVCMARHRVRDLPALTALNDALEMSQPPIVWTAQLASTSILASVILSFPPPTGCVECLTNADVDSFTIQIICNALYGLVLNVSQVAKQKENVNALIHTLSSRLIELLSEENVSADIQKEAYKQIASVCAALQAIDVSLAEKLYGSLERIERPVGVPNTNPQEGQENVSDCAMSGLQRRVGMALKRMSLPESVKLETEIAVKEGYEIDFALTKNHDKLAIEVDGPAHFYRLPPKAKSEGTENISVEQDRKVIASTRLKHELLEKAGWKVLQIPYWEWPHDKTAQKNHNIDLTAVPNLPSYRVSSDVAKTKHNRHQTWSILNDVRIEMKEGLSHDKPKFVKAPKQENPWRQGTTYPNTSNRDGYLVAEKDYDQLPAWDALDRLVLRFSGFFREAVNESNLENVRTRMVTVLYYLEDDSMQIGETPQDNSGIPQGTFIRRHRFPKEDGSYFTPEDLKVVEQLEIYAKNIVLTDCDDFTRAYYAKNGCEQPYTDLDAPVDSFQKTSAALTVEEPAAQQSEEKRYREAILGGGNPNQGMKQFLDNDRKVCRFYAVMEDVLTTQYERRPFIVLAFLSDQTIEIREQYPLNCGRDNFPIFFRRGTMPKNDEFCRSPSDAPLTKDESWAAKDLYVGQRVKMSNNTFFIYDADSFTRSHFADEWGVTLADKLDVQLPEKEIPRPPTPPYNGYGSWDDSMASVLNLIPKVPRKDFTNVMKNDGKILRFTAHFVNPKPEDAQRQFVFMYYLVDHTIAIHEPSIRNSGIVSGKFLEKGVHLNQKTGKLFTPEDFKVAGSHVAVFNHVFEVTGYDDYTGRYFALEKDHMKYPEESLRAIMEKLRDAMRQQDHNVKEVFRRFDEDSNGAITVDEFNRVLQKFGFKCSEEDITTLMRHFDLKGNGQISYNEFCDTVLERDYRESMMAPEDHFNTISSPEYAEKTIAQAADRKETERVRKAVRNVGDVFFKKDRMTNRVMKELSAVNYRPKVSQEEIQEALGRLGHNFPLEDIARCVLHVMPGTPLDQIDTFSFCKSMECSYNDFANSR
eukprot:gene498-179_t